MSSLNPSSAPQPPGTQPNAAESAPDTPSGMRLFFKLILLFVVMTIIVSGIIALITRYLEPIGKFFN